MADQSRSPSFFRWKRDLLIQLERGSQIAETAAGPIEYFTAGDGPVILGVHGTPGGYDQVKLVSAEMAGSGFRVIGWSRPGYLRTPLNARRDFAEQADAAARLLDSLGVERVCVYSASGGGPTGYYFAARHPDRVWALVAVCAISRQFGTELRPALRYLMKFAANDFGTYLVDWFATRFPRSTTRQTIRIESSLDRTMATALLEQAVADPAKIGFVCGLLRTMSPMSARLPGLRNDLDQFERLDSLPLEQIGCPALIIHGTHDATVPIAHGEYASRAVPHAEFMRVDGGTHLLWIAPQSEEIRTRSIEFLKTHAPI